MFASVAEETVPFGVIELLTQSVSAIYVIACKTKTSGNCFIAVCYIEFIDFCSVIEAISYFIAN